MAEEKSDHVEESQTPESSEASEDTGKDNSAEAEAPEVTEEAPASEPAEPATEDQVTEEKAVEAPAPEVKEPVKKKIEKMALADINARLEWIKKKMGTYPNSRYVQHLLKRRNALQGRTRNNS